MKILFLFLPLILIAEPQVGDKIFYSLQLYQGPLLTNRNIYSQEITKISSSTDYSIHHRETLSNGNRKEETFKVPRSQLKSKQEVDDLLRHCEKNLGILEVLKVEAGEFKTCKVIKDSKTEKITTWYGQVPIWGVVKTEVITKDFLWPIRSVRQVR